jgi:hypothetical protein
MADPTRFYIYVEMVRALLRVEPPAEVIVATEVARSFG